MTIGNYEVPIWGKQGWLAPLEFCRRLRRRRPAAGDPRRPDRRRQALRRALLRRERDDHVPHRPVREGRAHHARQARPGTFIGDAARKITDRANDINGICLRGKAGWGENMAFLDRAWPTRFGGRWFDEKWTPQFDQPDWKEALQFYADLMKDAGPAGASSNGFNENLTLFQQGKCAMWIDATVAASFVTDPKNSTVADKVGFALFPEQGRRRQPRQLALVLEPRDPGLLEERRRGQDLHRLGDLEGLHRARRREGGLGQRRLRAPAPRSTRTPTTRPPRPSPARRSAAMNAADITKPTRRPGALHRRPVRRDPRVPVDRHHGRPALLGGARRPVERRRRARPGPVGRPSAR